MLLWQDRRAVAQAEALPSGSTGGRSTNAPAACSTRATGRRSSPGWPSRARSAQARRIVSFADYLFLRLTGELRTTLSTASGSGLLDLRARTWDGELLEALGIDDELLPPLSDEPVGTSYPPLGDGACSNLGAGCVTPDRAALMIGTSGAYRVVREGEPAPRDGLFSYLLDERRVVEGGSISDGGNLLAWLNETLKLEATSTPSPTRTA